MNKSHCPSRTLLRMSLAALLGVLCFASSPGHGAELEEAVRSLRVEPVMSASTSWEVLVARSQAAQKPGPPPRTIRWMPLKTKGPLPKAMAVRPLKHHPAKDSSKAAWESPPLAADFGGLPDGGATPPDTNGAVGLDHLMVVLNDRVRIQDKQGQEISTATLPAFFSDLGLAIVFDPRVIFDALSNRFIVCAVADASGVGTKDSAVLLAVSASSDPEGTWRFWRFDADADDQGWADYPNMGTTSNYITITANMFTVGSDGFKFSRIWVVDKTSALNGGPLVSSVLTLTLGTGSTFVPAVTFDLEEDVQYLVRTLHSSSGGEGILRIATITGSVEDAIFSLPVAYPVAPHWSDPAKAQQQGTTATISTNEDRVLNAVLQRGRLWCTATIGVPAPPQTGERAAVRWWEIEPKAGLTIQSGVVTDPVMSYFFPSIAVNVHEEVLIGFSGSSPATYAGAYYTYRNPATPLGQTHAVQLLKDGESPYTKERWGDYSATCVDPVDNSLWTIQEYAAASGKWGTWWGHVSSVGKVDVPSNMPALSPPCLAVLLAVLLLTGHRTIALFRR